MAFVPCEMTLSSPAFAPGGRIPARHTGEGEDVSPPLRWENAPEGTKAFAVFCHDPDAPLISPNGSYGFAHWVLYNIPADVTELPEGVQRFTLGTDDTEGPGYNGPMPPEGHGVHRYYFWVIALGEEELHLPEGLTMWQMLERIEPYAIGMSRLVGTYERGL